MSVRFRIRNRTGPGMNLGIGNYQNDEYVLLAEGVKDFSIHINAPKNLKSDDNFLVYRTENGGRETFHLNKLIENMETTGESYISVLPQNPNQPINVSWKGVRSLYFKGIFRIGRTERRSAFGRKEWSIVNELPIEWYIQSVTSGEMPSDYTIDAFMAQAVASRTYFLDKAFKAREDEDRRWDIDPTQCNQIYKGVKADSGNVDIAVAETAGLVLTYNGEIVQTQYYACGRNRTKNGRNLVERRRNIPDSITCSKYARKLIDNHGLGMPQFVANELTKDGWSSSNSNLPTEGATVPENIREPWAWFDILYYFYGGRRSSLLDIQDFREW